MAEAVFGVGAGWVVETGLLEEFGSQTGFPAAIVVVVHTGFAGRVPQTDFAARTGFHTGKVVETGWVVETG